MERAWKEGVQEQLLRGCRSVSGPLSAALVGVMVGLRGGRVEIEKYPSTGKGEGKVLYTVSMAVAGLMALMWRVLLLLSSAASPSARGHSQSPLGKLWAGRYALYQLYQAAMDSAAVGPN